MCSDEIAMHVENVSKCYEMYAKPSHRLWQTLVMGRRKFYNDFWALREVSFKVKHGQCVGIIGRNGSGKSTLLQIIAGILGPTSGNVQTQGKIASLLELGSGFNPEFTGRENVYMNGMVLGLSKREIEQKYDQIVQFADIGEFVDQPVKTYSSGMVVRLAFAVITAVEPDIMLIDEALSVGDVFFQQKCVRYLREHLSDKSKIFVSHDLQLLSSISDFIIVLEHGRIIFQGNPSDAIEFYIKLQHSEQSISLSSETREVDPGSSSMQKRSCFNDIILWTDVNSEAVSGEGGFVILRYALIGEDGHISTTVMPGQRLRVHMQVQAKKSSSHPIVGYFFSDRTARQIFGGNTATQHESLPKIESPGIYDVSFEIDWPSLMPAEYTLTLGFGEGLSCDNQIVHCWAHSIHKVVAVNQHTEKSIFTCPMENFTIQRNECIC